jgi:hypothetical protein
VTVLNNYSELHGSQDNNKSLTFEKGVFFITRRDSKTSLTINLSSTQADCGHIAS